jgi:putative ABC transport system ATP-binding protein
LGKTIIMVTHENEVAAHAKRVVRLRDGLMQSDTLNGENRIVHLKQRVLAPDSELLLQRQGLQGPLTS